MERYLYSPYGVATLYDATWTNTRSQSSYDNVTLYTGRELDPETGLYYYRNRYCSAQLGRLVSRDPIEDEGIDINLYRYCANMPTIATDPDGRFVQLVGGGSLLKLLPIVGGGKVLVAGGAVYVVGYLPGKYVTGPIVGRIGDWWYDNPPLERPELRPIDSPPIPPSPEPSRRLPCSSYDCIAIGGGKHRTLPTGCERASCPSDRCQCVPSLDDDTNCGVYKCMRRFI